MSSRIHLVVGDRHPSVHVQLRQPDRLLDVSGATVFMKFRAEGSDIVLFQLVGELLPGTLQEDLLTPDLSQYPTPGSGGRVRFVFIIGNLNLPPGFYVGDIEIVYGPGNSFTSYPKLRFLLREKADA